MAFILVMMVSLCVSTNAFIRPTNRLLNNIIRSNIVIRQSSDSTPTLTDSIPQTDDRIPVSVIGGYFWCGKTTFVRNALQNNESLHVGVVIAEMDEVTKALEIETKDCKEIVELENKCMMCESDGDIFGAISRLIMANDLKHPNKKFDHIIIENSAYAEPRALTKQFKEAEMFGLPLMSKIKYGNMITVIDALTFAEFYHYTDHWNRGDGSVYDNIMTRVEYADVVVANKIDRRSEERLAHLVDVVNDLNPVCKQVYCVNVTLNMRDVLNAPIIDHDNRQIREPLPTPKKKKGHSTFVYKPKTAYKKGYEALGDGPIWETGMKIKDYKNTQDNDLLTTRLDRKRAKEAGIEYVEKKDQ